MFGYLFCMGYPHRQIEELINGELIQGNNFYCIYNKLEKFMDDKLFFDHETFFFLLDGIIFNKQELVNESGQCSWEAACEFYIEHFSFEEFVNKLRGNYSGIIYNKKTNRLIAFTDLIGEKAVYYLKNEQEGMIVASHMGIMKQAIKAYDIKYTVNIQACKEMLVTSSFLHGNTFLKNVYRLNGGAYLCLDNGSFNVNRYYMFHNIPEWELSLEECINKADMLFKQAIKRICNKNQEYGYDIEVDLSGGLDSRLVTFGIYNEGVKNVQNVCWCQSNRIDNIVSRKISQKLGYQYIFYKMDGGDFLKDVDRMTKYTGGQINYTSSTCANRVFSSLNLNNIGMAVTGLLGELHNGYWTKGMEHTAPQYDTAYTDVVSVRIPEEYSKEYENYEQMNLYELSGFTFMSSAFTRQQMVEVCSPFIDKDFLEFAYKIPLKWRKNDYFTLNWINKKYPEAAKFIWQKTMTSISSVVNNKFYFPKLYWGTEDFFIRSVNKILRIFHVRYQLLLRDDMNPFEKWYVRNASIELFYREYYKQTIDLVENMEIKQDIIALLSTGKCYDAMLAINILGIYRYYFGEVKSI